MSQTHMRPGRGPTDDTPRWVKVFVVIILVLLVAFVIMHLTGNGFGAHMHTSSVAHGAQQL